MAYCIPTCIPYSDQYPGYIIYWVSMQKSANSIRCIVFLFTNTFMYLWQKITYYTTMLHKSLLWKHNFNDSIKIYIFYNFNTIFNTIFYLNISFTLYFSIVIHTSSIIYGWKRSIWVYFFYFKKYDIM